MKPEVRILADPNQLAHEAAVEFARLATDSIKARNVFRVALSGGSTPKSLYSLLANGEPWRSELPWDKLHFFWSDERHVPPDHPDSNFRMANEAMFSKLVIPTENIHRIRGEEDDPAKAADEYKQDLEKSFHLIANQLPRFDLVLLGLGTDGHTASLFPDSDALSEREHFVAANWIAKLNAWRITLTFPLLNNAAHVLFLVSGSEKANILRAVLENDNVNQYPAQSIRPTSGRLLWLVDREAGASLSATVQNSSITK